MIDIIQSPKQINESDIVLIVDVLRCFTTETYLVLNGADRIYLTNDEQYCLDQKNKNPESFIIGEIGGKKIEGFDFGNSPFDIRDTNFKNKTIFHKTTNGVKFMLMANGKYNLGVGLCNADITAKYVQNLLEKEPNLNITIVSTHEHSDDDMAVSEYLKSKIENKPIEIDSVKNRIRNSFCGQRFLQGRENFKEEDLKICTKELELNFVLKKHMDGEIPYIKKEELC